MSENEECKASVLARARREANPNPPKREDRPKIRGVGPYGMPGRVKD